MRGQVCFQTSSFPVTRLISFPGKKLHFLSRILSRATPFAEMPEDEEKYFPSTGHSFKLRRPAGKKIGPEIQLNLVHEWSSFINVFSRNYSPLFLSLFDLPVGYSGSNSGFTRKAKEKSALWLPWICNECLPTAIFFSFRGERKKGREEISSITKVLDIDGKSRCIYDRKEGGGEWKWNLEKLEIISFRRWRKMREEFWKDFKEGTTKRVFTLSCSNPLFESTTSLSRR